MKRNSYQQNPQCDMKMHTTVTVGSKWQVVIPQDVRNMLGIKPGDTLMVITKHEKAIGMIKTDDMAEFMTYIQNEFQK